MLFGGFSEAPTEVPRIVVFSNDDTWLDQTADLTMKAGGHRIRLLFFLSASASAKGPYPCVTNKIVCPVFNGYKDALGPVWSASKEQT